MSMSHSNVKMQLHCSFNMKQALKCRLLAPLKIYTRAEYFLKEDMVSRTKLHCIKLIYIHQNKIQLELKITTALKAGSPCVSLA